MRIWLKANIILWAYLNVLDEHDDGFFYSI